MKNYTSTLVVALALVWAGTGCDTVSAGADIASAGGGATGDPTIVISSPQNNATAAYADPGVDVEVTVGVSNTTLGPAGHRVEYFLDGVSAGVADVPSHTFTGLPIGMHQLAARLVAQDGAPLPNPESVAKIHLKVLTVCGIPADCDDGLACTAEACKSGVCNYGPVSGCCAHDLDCAFGKLCVTGKCVDCGADADCDDGDACTTDTCAAGKCAHAVDPTCCDVDADCNDDDACTTDACDAGTCSFVSNGDPKCCNTAADCVPDNPCQLTMCYHSPKLPYPICRVGGKLGGCCYEDAGCADGNPCTTDTCDMSGGGESGLCQHVIPEGSICCVSKADCDDGDASTIDTCVANECQHAANPDYCALPATSAIVINEIMAAPGSLADGTAEWFEIYNASSELVDIAGWTIDAGAVLPMGHAKAFGGHAYFFATSPTAWAAAETACATYGAHLVTVDNAAENAWLATQIVGNNWIGYTDAAVEGTFAWVDGSSASYLNWFDTEPKTVTGSEDCALASGLPGAGGKWTAEDCADLHPFVCEFAGAAPVHILDPAKASGGAGGLVLAPGQYRVLARSADKALNGGLAVDYAYGNSIAFLDPFETSGVPFTQTVTLRDLAGAVVDSLTYDQSWPHADGASLVLENPFLDNALPTSWSAAGANVDPSLNKKYGPAGLGGTPRAQNRSAFVGIPDATCTPAGAGLCDIGRCGLSSECYVDKLDGCCLTDADCNDYAFCTIDACDTVSHTCLPPEDKPACCASNAACDDGNPCNLDRCYHYRCRHSPNVVAGCCMGDGDCDDGDACTVDTCDVGAHACEHSAVVPAAGKTCCNTAADCDDSNPATLNLCDTFGHVCVFPVDVDFCLDNTGTYCNDGDLCTVDACDLVTHKCSHTKTPGCCMKDWDCPNNANACEVRHCVKETGTCEQVAVPNCCNDNSDCDDETLCTLDVCIATHRCRHVKIAGCCTEDAACSDGVACTTDACTDNACVNTPITGCCTPGASQAVLVAQCGEDSDGIGPCYAWTCTAEKQCVEVHNSNCCLQAIDCDDSNACTVDFCKANHTCGHTAIPGCGCVIDADCPAGKYCGPAGSCLTLKTDGQPCTSDNECVAGSCVGSVCGSKASRGDACDGAADCLSGLCVDAVCCDATCDGNCEGCANAWPATTMTVDGETDDWGNMTDYLFGIGASGIQYLLTWDATHFYVSVWGVDTASDNVWVAFDQDPDPAPASGALAALGGADFHLSATPPEYVVGVLDSADLRYYAHDGSGGFADYLPVQAAPDWAYYAGWWGNEITELAIPRAALGALDPDAGFHVMLWAAGNNDYVWSTWPSGNGIGDPNQPASLSQFVRSSGGMCVPHTKDTDPDGDCSELTCDGQGGCYGGEVPM